MTMTWTVRARAMSLVAAGTLTGLGAVAAPVAAKPNDIKVTICHATAATTNPYRSITVDADAVDGVGANDHSSHAGPVFDVVNPVRGWGDIIPNAASGGVGEGLNWTAQGEAIYNGGACNGWDTGDGDGGDGDEGGDDGDPGDTDTQTPAKVTICHATSATTNPYRSITVAADAVDGVGRNDHSSHAGPVFDAENPVRGWGDIIPNAASGGVGEGLNWTSAGRAIFEAGCIIRTDEPSPETGGIRGLVWVDVDGDNTPDDDESRLSGVPVSATKDDDTTSTTTAVDGTYEIDGLEPGDHTVTIDVPADLDVSFDTDGGRDATVVVTVVKDTFVQADAAVAGTSGLQGRVVEETSGRPLADATVTCAWSGPDGVAGTADDQSFSTTADSNGGFLIVDAPTGDYSCSGTDPETGRTSATVTATVVDKSIASVELPIATPTDASSSSTASNTTTQSSTNTATNANYSSGETLTALPATGRASRLIASLAAVVALLGVALTLVSRRSVRA